jgi:hypothetical protein
MRNLERWHPLPNRSGAGFVLGMTLWVIPFFFRGEDGRLMESPIMLAVFIVAARWMVGRLSVPPTRENRTGMPEIHSDFGHPSDCYFRQPERSQLASPSGLWSHRTAPLALLAGS